MYCAWCREYPNIADKTSALVTGCTNFRIDALRNHDGSEKHLLCQARVKADKNPEQIPLKVAIKNYATKVDHITHRLVWKDWLTQRTT